ncbi:hypothetical protein HPP92_022093 [Vanilla planifolia]|uniref:Uncharacterized protein n=1 Tax=Vanilla planifolia TaxID=51239 RepID=A0A835PMX3_VANPL|nr:hypothetical protein HPP92_022093 [Vanilla planifolia]
MSVELKHCVRETVKGTSKGSVNGCTALMSKEGRPTWMSVKQETKQSDESIGRRRQREQEHYKSQLPESSNSGRITDNEGSNGLERQLQLRK